MNVFIVEVPDHTNPSISLGRACCRLPLNTVHCGDPQSPYCFSKAKMYFLMLHTTEWQRNFMSVFETDCSSNFFGAVQGKSEI